MKHTLLLLMLAIPGLTASGQQQDKVKLYTLPDGRILHRAQRDSIYALNQHILYRMVKNSVHRVEYAITYYDRPLLLARYKTDGNYCGNPGKLPLREIQKRFPFNKTQTIQLVSFDTGSLPLSGSQLDLQHVRMACTVTRDRMDDLADILVNYAWEPGFKDLAEVSQALCFDPHEAIVFLDSQHTVIAFVEICFTCFSTRLQPSSLFGNFCNEKFEILQEMFIGIGARSR